MPLMFMPLMSPLFTAPPTGGVSPAPKPMFIAASSSLALVLLLYFLAQARIAPFVAASHSPAAC